MSRIYAVHKKEDGADVALVKADTKAGALRHVAEKTMTAEVPSQEDLVKLIQAGVKVEDAKAEAPDEKDSKTVWPK
jgi:hypothetical protein